MRASRTTCSPSAISSAAPPPEAVAEPPDVPRNQIVVREGATIFRQGDPGDSMYIIEQGRVCITLRTAGQVAAVADLGPGEFFGELSLLSNVARTATAVALEDATLLVVGREVFAMMMQDDLEVVLRMLHAMGERLGRTDRQMNVLLERQGRLRLLAEALRRAGAASTRTPVVIEVDRLANDLRLDGATVRAMVAEVVGRGAGALEDERWRLDGPEHVGALLELLHAYAEEDGATGSPAGPSSG